MNVLSELTTVTFTRLPDNIFYGGNLEETKGYVAGILSARGGEHFLIEGCAVTRSVVMQKDGFSSVVHDHHMSFVRKCNSKQLQEALHITPKKLPEEWVRTFRSIAWDEQ